MACLRHFIFVASTEEKEARKLASDKRAMELEVIKSNQKAKQKANRVEKTRTSFDEHRVKMEEARKREAKIAEHEKNVNVIDYIKDSRQMNRDFETQRARNKSQADIAHQIKVSKDLEAKRVAREQSTMRLEAARAQRRARMDAEKDANAPRAGPFA